MIIWIICFACIHVSILQIKNCIRNYTLLLISPCLVSIKIKGIYCHLGQFNSSVLSDYLRPHGLQHIRPPCPSPTPGVYSNSCPFIESLITSNHPILCRPLLHLPSIFPSIRFFSSEAVLRIREPKY